MVMFMILFFLIAGHVTSSPSDAQIQGLTPPEYEGIDPYLSPDLIKQIRALYGKISSFYLPTSRKVNNDDCSTVVNAFLFNLRNGIKSWSLIMGDSWGKVPDGFFFGNVHPLGMYEECLLIDDVVNPLIGKEVPFKGKHCTIYYQNKNMTLMDILTRQGTFHEARNMVRPSPRSGPAIAVLLRPLPFSYGTCMPSVCTSQDLKVSLEQTFESIDRKVEAIYCSDEETSSSSLDGYDIAVISLISIAIFLSVFASLLKTLKRTKYQHRAATGFSDCFSIVDNFRQIFKYSEQVDAHEIQCLHGLRSLTMLWIILCHQFQVGAAFVMNNFNLAKYQDPVLAQIVSNGWMAVETFFCLTGILITYKLFNDSNGKTTRVSVVQMILGRFLRLAPAIFIVAAFSSTLLRFLGWGPRKHLLEDYTMHVCRKYWWKDPVFINNYDFGDNGIVGVPDCLGHCWYTAIDMQLHLILPFILIPLTINFRGGVLWLLVVSATSVIVPLSLSLANDYPPFPVITTTIQAHYEYMTGFYLTPWCRAGPLVVGLWAGLFLALNHSFRKVNKIIIWIATVAFMCMMAAIVFSLYPHNHLGTFDRYGKAESSFYNGFARPAWAVAISFIVIACHTGSLKYVNLFLGWPGWKPLSRLTFSMYLIHPVVQLWWVSTQFVPLYFTYLSKLMESAGIFFLSFLVAILLSILIERPVMSIYRRILNNELENKLQNETENGVPETLQIPRAHITQQNQQ